MLYLSQLVLLHMTCVMPRPSRPTVLRQACDRCHAQKLSCQRSIAEAPCKRCLRANTACISSPSLRNRRNRPLLRQAVSNGLESPVSQETRGEYRGGSEPLLRAQNTLHLEARPMTEMPGAAAVQMLQPHNETFDSLSGLETQPWMDEATDYTMRQLPESRNNSYANTPESSTPASSGRDILSVPLNAPAAQLLRQPQIIESPCNVLQSLFKGISPISATATTERLGLAGHTPEPSRDQIAGDLVMLSSTSTSYEALQSVAEKIDVDWLQEIVEINMQLFNHAEMTKRATTAATGDYSHDSHSNNVQNLDDSDFDRTLIGSLRFIQALRKLHGTCSRDLLTQIAPAHLPSLDPGTTLVVYSCYVRVIELLTSRLGAIRDFLNNATAINLTRNGQTGGSVTIRVTFPPMALPSLVACSCSLDEYPVLRLRMTLELVEEILDVMGALFLPLLQRHGAEQQEQNRAMPWLARTSVPEISQEALRGREEVAYQVIQNIRRELKASRHATI